MKTLLYFVVSSMLLCTIFLQPSVAGDGDKNGKTISKKERKCTIKILPINSSASEFSPVFYKDGLLFCSTRQAPIWSGLGGRNKDMDLYYSERKSDKSYTSPRRLRGEVNTRKDEGPFSVTSDGQQLFFTKTKSKKSKNEIPTLGIFSARLVNGKEWKDIRKFGGPRGGWAVSEVRPRVIKSPIMLDHLP